MPYLLDNKTVHPSDHTHMGRQIGKGRVASADLYVCHHHPPQLGTILWNGPDTALHNQWVRSMNQSVHDQGRSEGDAVSRIRAETSVMTRAVREGMHATTRTERARGKRENHVPSAAL